MDSKLKMSLSIVFGGYIFSIAFCLTWYSVKSRYTFDEILFNHAAKLEIIAVLFAITAIYLLLLLSILSIESFQTPWKSFLLLSMTLLLTFSIIPSLNYARNHFKKAEEKVRTERKRMKEIDDKLYKAIKKNYVAEKFIEELQAKLKSEREENNKLKKQLNGLILKTKSVEEEYKTKGDVIVQAKSNKNFSTIKTNSKVVNTDSDTKSQEIIFKVQIIASSTRLTTKSPSLKGIKNVWEYKDHGLFKYTVGNQKDLKSASMLQSKFRKKGFSGAFVVAFKNGKRIPLRESL